MTEGPISAGVLSVRIVSDAGTLGKDVERQVNQASAKAVGAIDKTGKTVSQRARSIGGKASLFLTAPLLLGAKAALDAGSDVVESTNKVNVVFGEQGKAIVAWSETTAESFGVSKREALDAAGTFGNLFRAMGIGAAQASSTSKNLTQLAGDMASFNNADPSEVLLALRSGLVGETEPLRKFGININQARLEAEAYSLGLVKATKNQGDIKISRERLNLAIANAAKVAKEHGKNSEESRRAMVAVEVAQRSLNKATKGSVPQLTAAQKAQASYSLIMQDTKLQQGDFQRSLSTSAANQERVNKALADNAKAAIGQQLLPMYQRALITVGHLAAGFSHLSGGQQKLVVALGLSLAALGPILTVAGNVKRAYGGVAGASTKLVRGSAGLVKGFRNVDSAMSANASTSTRVGAGIRSQLQLFGQQAKALGTTVAGYARATGAAIANAVATVRQRVATLAAAAAQRAVALATRIAAAAQWLLNAAMTANPIGLVIAALVLLAVGLVVLYKKVGFFRAIVQATWGWIKAHWPLLLAIITGPIGLAVLFIVRHWDAVKEKTRAVVSAVVGFFTGLPARIGRGLANLGSLIMKPFNWASGKVSGVVDKVVGFFTGLPGRMAKGLASIGDVFLGPFKAAFNGIANLWNGTVGKLSFKAPGWVPHFGGKGFDVPDIPTLGAGGTLTRGGSVLVGERGRPEILDLPAGATVTPLDRHRDGATVIVQPAPGMSEEHIGRVAARELEWALR